MACGPEITGGGPGGREPPRDEPRDPKRKKEKPREVKILWNSSAKPGTGEAYRPSGVLLNSFDLGGLWPGNNRGGPGGREPPGMSREAPKGKRKSQGRSRYCEIAQPSPEPGRHTDLREYCSVALTWAACGLEITEKVRGGGSPPGMSREAPKGKRKSQGRSRYCEIAQPSPEPGGAYRPSGILLNSLDVGGLRPVFWAAQSGPAKSMGF